jgi:hypothetical protein
LLDRGAVDTLHTGVLTAWLLLVVLGTACWWIDRRPALAAAWLAPFVALSQVRSAGAAMIVAGLLIVAAVLTAGTRATRLASS